MSSRERLWGFRILLVEDEVLVGTIIGEWLSDNGANVAWARTDAEAYDILQSAIDEIDLLITDINLRFGTTGFDVARFARRLNPHIAVIYLSGDVPEPASTPDWGVEGALFLAKPVLEGRLIEAILNSSPATRADTRITIGQRS